MRLLYCCRNLIVTEQDALLADRLELSTEVHCCNKVNQEVRCQRVLKLEIAVGALSCQTNEHVAAWSDDLEANRNVVKTNQCAVVAAIELRLAELFVVVDTTIDAAVCTIVAHQLRAVQEHECLGVLELLVCSIVKCLQSINSIDICDCRSFEEVALLCRDTLVFDLLIRDSLEAIVEICGFLTPRVSLSCKKRIEETLTHLGKEVSSNELGDRLVFECIALENV